MYAIDHPGIAGAIRPALRRPVLARVRRIGKSVLEAFAAGTEHPMWTTLDARDRAALLPHAQYDRLLDEGRVPARR
jgi:hypothetical protein